MHFSLGFAAVVATGLCFAWRVDAQTTTAICTTDPWTSNHDDLSPCAVASALQAVCNGGKWTIDPLSLGSQYSGPLAHESNPCQCSTVVFSLVAACGACQGGSVATWPLWKTNCSQTDISVSSYPLSIPSGISIPSWAYLNVTGSGIWDPTAALNTHNSGAPDSSAVSGTASSTSGSSTSTSNSTPSSTASSKAGPIAGGVVGGVVGVALIGMAAFVFIRRRRNATATPASAQFAGGRVRREKVDLTGHAPSYGGLETPALPMQNEPPRLYDPSDPSTFPASPSPSLPGYTTSTSPVPSAPYSQTSGPFSTVSGPLSPLSYSQGHIPGAISQGHLHQASQGGYTGVPEV